MARPWIEFSSRFPKKFFSLRPGTRIYIYILEFLKRIEWKIDGRDLVRELTANKNELVRLLTPAKRISFV